MYAAKARQTSAMGALNRMVNRWNRAAKRRAWQVLSRVTGAMLERGAGLLLASSMRRRVLKAITKA